MLTEASYPDGSREPAHAHEYASLLWVASGHLAEHVGERIYPCTVTGVMWKPAGVAHADEVSSPSRVLVLELLPEFLGHLDTEWGASLEEPRLVSGAPAVLFARLLPYLAGEGDPSALDELVAAVWGGARLRGCPPESSEPDWLRRVRDRLHDTPRARDSLTELARLAEVHPIHLARTFRARFGYSVTEYRHRRRVDLAVEALASRREDIGRLALRLGYYDHAHFTRVFRRMTGLSPSAYRAIADPAAPD